MQSTHFADFWRPRLTEDGYDAIFKKKGNDMYISGNVAAIDGCATFFKRSRFNLVKKYEVLPPRSYMLPASHEPRVYAVHKNCRLCQYQSGLHGGRAQTSACDALVQHPSLRKVAPLVALHLACAVSPGSMSIIYARLQSRTGT